MGMTIAISRPLLDAILADCRRDATVERCGLLLGQGGAITGFVPAANIHPEPQRHFELDPAVLLAAHRQSRSGGPRLLGHYHSHPQGMAAPSAADAAAADADGRLWLIATAGDWTMWRAVADGDRHGRFVAVTVRISDPDIASASTRP
jgi:proteasome lid subunit RPN8/RPN11